MNIVDIIIIVGLILGALTGFIRGFFKQTVVFLGTILVVVLAFLLKNPLSLIMYNSFKFFSFGGLTSLNILLYEVIAFIIALVILSLIFAIILKVTGIIETVLKATVVLALPFKLLGMIVGIIESIVLMYVILFILSIPVFKVPYINESKNAQMILTKTPIISSITEDVVTSFNEISEFTKDINLKDVRGTNRQILEVLLKNKVVTTENVKILVDNDKLDIDNIEDLIEEYKDIK